MPPNASTKGAKGVKAAKHPMHVATLSPSSVENYTTLTCDEFSLYVYSRLSQESDTDAGDEGVNGDA